MPLTLVVCGDVNLMNVADPTVPFARVQATLAHADARFANLECCFFEPAGARSTDDEGFYAGVNVAESLRIAGFDAVGTANNVNYGVEAILSSLATLDRLGIAHSGTGPDAASAHAPAIVERGGARIGFIQRTCVYWPTNHEAGEHSAGVAALRAHTAYLVPAHKTRPDIPPMNRPGVPPEVMTWADATYLQRYTAEVKALRARCDTVVSSHHWGLKEDVLTYMEEIAHAAIDAGADAVMGHGPHYALPVEIYKGKPIFYGLGNFSFDTGHGGRKHGDWIGMAARLVIDGGEMREVTFRFVRHDAENRSYLSDAATERQTLDGLNERSAKYGTRYEPRADGAVTLRAREA